MIKDERGSITIFLAAVFLVFLLLISMCTEGIYLYIGRGKAMGACMAGLSHVRGNYQKELEREISYFCHGSQIRDKKRKKISAGR